MLCCHSICYSAYTYSILAPYSTGCVDVSIIEVVKTAIALLGFALCSGAGSCAIIKYPS